MRFAIGGGGFAVEVSRVRGVQGLDRLQRSPAPDGPVGWLLGATQETPVFTLNRLVGLPDATDDQSGRLVVLLDCGAQPLGLLVDRVSAPQDAPAQHRLPVPAVARGERAVFASVLRFGDQLSLLLDPRRLLERTDEGNLPRRVPRPPGRRSTAAPTAPTAVKRGRRQLLVVRLHEPGLDLALGLSLLQVVEIRAAPPCLPVPSASRLVLGLASWRDSAVPVIDLRQALGLPPPPSARRERQLVARTCGGDLVAFAVPEDLSVEPPPPAAAPAAWPFPAGRAFLRGVFASPAGVLGVLDLDRILDGEGGDLAGG